MKIMYLSVFNPNNISINVTILLVMVYSQQCLNNQYLILISTYSSMMHLFKSSWVWFAIKQFEYLSPGPPTGGIWHKAFSRWVWTLGH